MRRIQNIWAAGLGVLLACQACQLGADDGIARSSFGEELVHAVCDTVPTCCQSAELAFEPFDCSQKVLSPYGGKVAVPAVGYDAEAAADCIEAARTLTERCEQVPASVCDGAFRGTIPQGGRCQTTSECDPGPGGHAVCSPEGTCIGPPRGTHGQPCSYTCRAGGPTARCKNVSGTMGAVQTACFEDDNLVCHITGEGSPTCQDIRLDCRDRVDEATACPPGGFCDRSTGTCVGFSPISGPCDTNGGNPRCGQDAFCHGGTCHQKFPVTAPCNDAVQCLSGRCSSGFCTLFSPAAAALCQGTRS